MLRHTTAFALLALVTGATDHGTAAHGPGPADPDLTVHEWGTFTTIAGQDGRAIDWLPLDGPTDLPCFVEHFQNRRVRQGRSESSRVPWTTRQPGRVSRGKVRMETPVLYFYAARAKTVSVHVRFPHGRTAEWYPRATVTQPSIDRNSLRSPSQASAIVSPRT